MHARTHTYIGPHTHIHTHGNHYFIQNIHTQVLTHTARFLLPRAVIQLSKS